MQTFFIYDFLYITFIILIHVINQITENCKKENTSLILQKNKPKIKLNKHKKFKLPGKRLVEPAAMRSSVDLEPKGIEMMC